MRRDRIYKLVLICLVLILGNQNSFTISSQKNVDVPKDGFSFAIESDPHFDEKYDKSLIDKTAMNIIDLKPNFIIDLGDTSMIEKFGKTKEELNYRKELVDEYFSKFEGIPVKMVTGNHDVAINTKEANYYSFVVKNAQFIVLDPYAFSSQKVSKGNGWAVTLGWEQYSWLKTTLENSSSEFKFIFIHNIVGGMGKDSRGGVEASNLYEWGGKNEEMINEFANMRKGWELPIHDLLVKYKVDVVFHGHDHFYAKQERDGIIYQLVPQPGTLGKSAEESATYGYKEGEIFPSAGYIRVVVSKGNAIIEYLKTEKNIPYSIPNVYVLNKN